MMFFGILSQLYQGLGPIRPPPYHEPEAVKFTESPEFPHPALLCDDLSAPLWKQPGRMAMEFVAFRLTAKQLTELHNGVVKGTEGLRMSKVDPVVGLLSRCLSEVEPESKPIDTISHVVNVRGIHLPSLHSAYFATAPRNGNIPAQCGAQRHLLDLFKSTSLEWPRSS